LRRDLSIASQVARKVFPAFEAELLPELIRRDLPFYDASISPEFVADMNKFLCDFGLLNRTLNYDQFVATQFCTLLHASSERPKPNLSHRCRRRVCPVERAFPSLIAPRPRGQQRENGAINYSRQVEAAPPSAEHSRQVRAGTSAAAP